MTTAEEMIAALRDRGFDRDDLARLSDAELEARYLEEEERQQEADAERRIGHGIGSAYDVMGALGRRLEARGVPFWGGCMDSHYYGLAGRTVRISDVDPDADRVRDFGVSGVDVNTSRRLRHRATHEAGQLTPEGLDDLADELAAYCRG